MARTRSQPAASPKALTPVKSKKVIKVASVSPSPSKPVKRTRKSAKKEKTPEVVDVEAELIEEEEAESVVEQANEAEKTVEKHETKPEQPKEQIVQGKVITKALSELTKYLERENEKENTKEKLFDDDDDNTKTLLLQLNTKKFAASKSSFKPKFIKLTNPIYNSETRTCLIVRDQLVKTTEQLEALENENLPTVTQILPIKALKTDYKTYEKRRQLKKEYDLFIVDDAVFNLMPTLLGKTFYATGSKRVPLPIRINVPGTKDLSLPALREQLDKCLNSTIYLKPTGVNISIKVGAISPKFTHEQLAQNLQDALSTFEKDTLKSVMIRTPKSPSLPLYYAEKLYDDNDLIENVGDAEPEQPETEELSVFEKGLLELGDAEEVAKIIGLNERKQKPYKVQKPKIAKV